jgi:hypothetical protein
MSQFEGLQFHSAQPEARQDTYIEYNNVDFILAVGEGKSLMRNSVRINGDIEITKDGTARAEGKVFLDPRIGVHACIDSIQTNFQGAGGVKEVIANYGRWACMDAVGTIYEDDYNSAKYQVEQRAPTENVAARLALGEVTLGTTPITQDLDFSIKPLCVLNKMSGDNLPFEKSGEIRVTINLARNMAALMGANQGTGATYVLRNLHCSYSSVPTEKNPAKTTTTMRSVYNVKSTILSGSANIQAQVPAMCDAMSASFQAQNRENVNVFSNYDCNTVPGITNLEFLFNDATNKYITYQMTDQNEMVHRYIDSFHSTGHQQMTLDKFRTNKGFGVGLNFQGFIDLSQQRFGLQLDSDVNNLSPYNVYMYFHSIISA